MSTNINITVDNSSLTLAAKLIQEAARESQQKKESDKKLEDEAAKAAAAEEAERAKNGRSLGQNGAGQGGGSISDKRDAQGNPLFGSKISIPTLNRRPAANRRDGNTETVSAAFLAYAGTDWNTPNIAFSYAWEGSNQGPSVWLSSLDGSYWLSDTHIAEGASNWSFLTGAGFNGDTGSSIRYRDTSSTRRSMQRIIFPAGKGNFVLVMRYSQAATANAAYDSTYQIGITPPAWAVTYQVTSEPQEAFFSYYVSEKSVKKISTPESVKAFFRRKMTSIIIKEFLASQGGTTWIGSGLPFLGAWSLPDPNSGYPSNTLDFPLTFSYLPDESGQLPSSDIRSGIIRSSPFVYATNADTNADINNFPDSGAGFFAWRNAVLDAGPLNATGPLVARPLFILLNSLINAEPPAIANIDIGVGAAATSYIDWKTPDWRQYIELLTNPPKLKIAGSSSETAFIFNEPTPMPASFSEIVTAGKPAAAGNILLCSDWGMPGYCLQQLLALGFTSADLTPGAPTLEP